MDHATVRALGITGDSLTLLGSITLVIETLLRPRTLKQNRASLDTAKELKSGDLDLVNNSGETVNQETLEKKDVSLAHGLAVLGVLLLVVGFSFLLVIRIWGE